MYITIKQWLDISWAIDKNWDLHRLTGGEPERYSVKSLFLIKCLLNITLSKIFPNIARKADFSVVSYKVFVFFFMDINYIGFLP